MGSFVPGDHPRWMPEVFCILGTDWATSTPYKPAWLAHTAPPTLPFYAKREDSIRPLLSPAVLRVKLAPPLPALTALKAHTSKAHVLQEAIVPLLPRVYCVGQALTIRMKALAHPPVVLSVPMALTADKALRPTRIAPRAAIVLELPTCYRAQQVDDVPRSAARPLSVLLAPFLHPTPRHVPIAWKDTAASLVARRRMLLARTVLSTGCCL